jgi:ATP-dependent exoDNAse (exonuclease V) beta subunit
MERVFGLGREIGEVELEQARPSAREEATARGRVVHSLLEWCEANDWREPPAELAAGLARAEGLGDGPVDCEELLAPVRGWLESELFERRVRGREEVLAEAPILVDIGESVLRGNIDLLIEGDGATPLVVDYKTDRLGGESPAEHAGRYSVQRSIYALAVSEAREAEEVEVAYVFLERPDEPQVSRLGGAELREARARLTEVVGRISAGEFQVAPPERRSNELCRGCPALGRACSGPER